jgi:hypothetical protein
MKIVYPLSKGNLLLARLMTNNCDCLLVNIPMLIFKKLRKNLELLCKMDFMLVRGGDFSKKRPLTRRREMRQKEKNSYTSWQKFLNQIEFILMRGESINT